MLHDALLHAASDDDALLLSLHLHHPNWHRSSVIHLFFFVQLCCSSSSQELHPPLHQRLPLKSS
jgi:hypothetical protein